MTSNGSVDFLPQKPPKCHIEHMCPWSGPVVVHGIWELLLPLI